MLPNMLWLEYLNFLLEEQLVATFVVIFGFATT